jgi:hypothetical protein
LGTNSIEQQPAARDLSAYVLALHAGQAAPIGLPQRPPAPGRTACRCTARFAAGCPARRQVDDRGRQLDLADDAPGRKDSGGGQVVGVVRAATAAASIGV